MEGINNHVELSLHIDGIAVIVPPRSEHSTPVHFIAVIDISASMGYAVSNDVESVGFSRLDLVKHCLNTMVAMTDSGHDHITLISFSDSAKVLMDYVLLNEQGRKNATRIISTLRPTYSTNLWSGVLTGLQHVRLGEGHSHETVFVLTDGQSNQDPPLGVLTTFQQHVQLHGLPCSSVNFFGLGYDIDSSLLTSLSTVGRGLFSYIPDATMCGTVFINFVANMQSVVMPRAQVYAGDNKSVLALRSEQPVSVIFKHDDDQPLKITVDNDGVSHTITMTVEQLRADCKQDQKQVHDCRARQEFITLLQKIVTRMQLNDLIGAEEEVNVFIAFCNSLNGPVIQSLLLELQSANPDQAQVTKAISSREWYHKWGFHHIQSLTRAHELQMCHNFRDPSVQLYNNPLFLFLQQRGLALFKDITPPPPSCAVRPVSVADIDMGDFVDPQGGCFAGDLMVRVQSPLLYVPVSSLAKGDILYGGAQVRCVVIHVNKSYHVVAINDHGDLLTPWHPVRSAGASEWSFAKNSPSANILHKVINKVYNLVLSVEGDQQHAVITRDNQQIITLGHGIKGDAVAEHSYFGSGRIISDLQQHPGFEDGLIELDMSKFDWVRGKGMLPLQPMLVEYCDD